MNLKPISPIANLDIFPYGLPEADYAQKILNQTAIESLKLVHPKFAKQPSFFISNDSWKKLSNPSWLIEPPHLYTVYGFVFCYGLYGDSEQMHKIENDRELNGKIYFRIRTILKETSLRGTLFVNVDEIAYVDLKTALSNNKIPTPPPVDCLKFIDNTDTTGMYQKVNDDVTIFKTSRLLPRRIYPKVIVPSLMLNTFQTERQEGDIFGKSRIWEDLIQNITATGTPAKPKYPYKNTDISIAKDPKGFWYFVFRINQEVYTDGINCPPPDNPCKPL